MLDERLSRLLEETFSAKLDDLSDESQLRDLEDWDSLAYMRFVLALESEFSIDLSGDEIANLETVAHVRDIIAQKVAK